jgi:hypothetical protein
MDHPNPPYPDDGEEPVWTLPLHGAVVAGGESAPFDPAGEPYLPPDDYVPPLDFQPRLSRFGEAA